MFQECLEYESREGECFKSAWSMNQEKESVSRVRLEYESREGGCFKSAWSMNQEKESVSRVPGV